MPDIYLHSRKLTSVFELLGDKENDITYSIGWALARCPNFLRRLLREVCPGIRYADMEGTVLRLQQFGKKDRGYTDIEIVGHDFHIIIEAKRGWNLPTKAQLIRYSTRLNQTQRLNSTLVCMSECSRDYIRLTLPRRINRFPVRHLNWKDVDRLARLARGTHSEVRLLMELRSYLRRIVHMQNQESNWVYVVALSRDEWAPGLSFIDTVEKRGRYFHPFGEGKGWPTEPPNYLGFRYGGRLQSIHHVKKAEVTRSFRPFFPESTRSESKNFLHYKLGPAIRPMHEVRTGRLFRNGRVWAMLDLLLTCRTISQARDNSKRRSGEK